MEIIFIIAFIAIAILVPVFVIVRKKRRLHCPNCKTRLHYSDVIAAEVVADQVHQGIGVATSDVSVVCKCPNCHTEKTFTVKFKSADRKEGVFGDKIQSYDLNKKLRDYFGG